MSDGRVEAIYLKPAKRAPMKSLRSAELRAGRGIVGNANQGGRRQVTLLDRARWERAMRDIGGGLSPEARRANLLLSGIVLVRTTGRVLRIGTCRVRILGETKPCPRMDEAQQGLRRALAAGWGGGAFAEVLDDGPVAIGDVVRWEDEPSGENYVLPL